MQCRKLSIGMTAVLAAITVTLFMTGTRTTAQTEQVLHSFQGNGKGGDAITAGLISDAAGNLYGTTLFGGSGSCTSPGAGCGTVFELSPKAGGGWTEKVLHVFSNNGKDGQHPNASLAFGAGNLYGTTYGGGVYGYGTVFELTLQASGGWAERILRSFKNSGTGGYAPFGSLILDASGNLYGTASAGGAGSGGTVFELAHKAGGGWTELVLHSFNLHGKDGHDPNSGLVFDAAGNLYGTTYSGGAYAVGTVFELTPKAGGGWTGQVLYSFNDRTQDGYNPNAGLIFAAGNLYGTTSNGGAYVYGTVFELTPATGGGWTETVLHDFNANGSDGYYPWAGLILDTAGNLYGTTTRGGAYGSGTVFELTPTGGGSWTEKILHNFGSATDGADPYASLIFDATGNLYGTTEYGGTNSGGTVFEITP